MIPLQFVVFAGATPADIAADPRITASLNSEGYKPVSIAEAEAGLSHASGPFYDCGEMFYWFTSADHPEASRLASIHAPCDPDLIWEALDSDAVAVYGRALIAA